MVYPTCSITDADGFKCPNGETSWNQAREIFREYKSVKHDFDIIRLIPAMEAECPLASDGQWVILEGKPLYFAQRSDIGWSPDHS